MRSQFKELVRDMACFFALGMGISVTGITGYHLLYRYNSWLDKKLQ